MPTEIHTRPITTSIDPDLRDAISELSREVAATEAGASQPGRTSGEATGGQEFEEALGAAFTRYGQALVDELGAEVLNVRVVWENEDGKRRTRWKTDAFALRIDNRIVLVRRPGLLPPGNEDRRELEVPAVWLKHSYTNEELFGPGRDEALYADGGVLRGHNPEDVRDLGRERVTRFDGVLLQITYAGWVPEEGSLAVENLELTTKALLEAKSAKSSDGESIDGNAHERFGMQALLAERAILYDPVACTVRFQVFINDAFYRYESKYAPVFADAVKRLNRGLNAPLGDLTGRHWEYRKLFIGYTAWLLADPVA